MEIGTKIKQLRTQHRLSQEALAEKLQLSRQAVAKWETGDSLPSMANLLALCELFEVSLDEFSPHPKAKQESPPHWSQRRDVRLGLLLSSLLFTLLSAFAWFLHSRQPFPPPDAIGGADQPTTILITGLPLSLCLFTGFTLLLLAATGIVFWTAWRKEKERRK